MHARQIGPLNLGAKLYVRKKSQMVLAQFEFVLCGGRSGHYPEIICAKISVITILQETCAFRKLVVQQEPPHRDS